MADERPINQKQLSTRLISYDVRSSIRTVLSRLQSVYPKLVPLAICLGVLPILALFSLAAGWVVWRNVPEGWQVPVYLVYGDGVPHSDLEIRSIASSQPYDIFLHLSVPASESNHELGNFMVSLNVRTSSNATVLDARKPALILPSSKFFGIFRSSRLLEVIVPLATSVPISSSRVKAHIDIGRSDSWRSVGNGHGQELTVYEASLRGHVKPQGLQRLISAFPISSAVAVTITFFSISSLVLSACLLQAAIQQSSNDVADDTEQVKEEEEEEENISSEADEQSSSLTALRRRHSRSQDAGHAGINVYPTPEPDSRHRNRRRSSIQVEESS